MAKNQDADCLPSWTDRFGYNVGFTFYMVYDQSLIFGYGFWNVGYGYKCRGYPDFGFGFRFWKIGEFYENLGP